MNPRYGISESAKVLLSRDSQFEEGDVLFNLEAYAIYLKALRDKYGDQIYLAAGPADVRVQLARLQFDMVGDQAFILFCSYIHAEVFFIRKEIIKEADGTSKEVMCGFLFDSQAWGMRNYANRLICESFFEQFPNGRIYFSNNQIQSQEVQRGCQALSLSCLSYLQENGSLFFKELAHLDVKSLQHPWLPNEEIFEFSLPFEIVRELEAKNHDFYLEELDNLLKTYQCDDGLDVKKINHTLDEMQGCDLAAVSIYECALYSLKYDSKENTLIIQFDNKDYIYANFLLYSFARFAYQVKRNEVPAHVLSENFKHLPDKKQLIFSVKSLRAEDLLKAIRQLQHVHQRLALKTFCHQVEETVCKQIELEKTCTDEIGGFDTYQVQSALTHIFAKKEAFFIPSVEQINPTGPKLDLDALQKRYSHVVFLLPLDSVMHHLAVGIELKPASGEYIVHVYDSEGDEEDRVGNLREAKEILSKILVSTQSWTFSPEASFLPAQKDKWSCAFHGKETLEIFAGLKDASSPFDPRQAADECYDAWQIQENKENILRTLRPKQQQDISTLSQILEDGRKQYPEQQDLKDLLEYVSHVDVNQTSHSLYQIWQAYDNKHKGYDSGAAILRMASLYPGELERFRIVSNKLFFYINLTPKLKEELEKNREKWRKLEDWFNTQLSMYLERSGLRSQLYLFKKLLNEFSEHHSEDDHALLYLFLKEYLGIIDDTYKKDHYQKYFKKYFQKPKIPVSEHIDTISLHLLINCAMRQLKNLTASSESLESRLISQQENNFRIRKKLEQDKLLADIKEILSASGFPLLNEEKCMALAKRPGACYFLRMFVRGSDYFKGADEVSANEMFDKIVKFDLDKYKKQNGELDLVKLLKIMPMHVRFSIVEKYQDEINGSTQIKSCKKLGRLLACLSVEDREKLLRLKQNLISNFKTMMVVMQFLPDDEFKLRFAVHYSLKFVRGSDESVGFFSQEIHIVLSEIEPKNKHRFLIHIKERMTPGTDDLLNALFDIYNCWRSKKLNSQIAMQCEDRVTKYKQMSSLLYYLDEENYCEFLLKVCNRLFTCPETVFSRVEETGPLFDLVLALLKKNEHQEEFIQKINCPDLNRLLGLLEITAVETTMFKLIKANIDKIPDKESLQLVLNKIPAAIHAAVEETWATAQFSIACSSSFFQPSDSQASPLAQVTPTQDGVGPEKRV